MGMVGPVSLGASIHLAPLLLCAYNFLIVVGVPIPCVANSRRRRRFYVSFFFVHSGFHFSDLDVEHDISENVASSSMSTSMSPAFMWIVGFSPASSVSSSSLLCSLLVTNVCVNLNMSTL